MACFVVPATEAIVTTIAAKVVKSTENHSDNHEASKKTSFSRKLGWLNKMLWGGSALLAFEHVWHGEVVPFFPFLTAAENPESLVEMLHEMSTVGVTMAALVTVAWIGMVSVSTIIENRAANDAKENI